MSSPSPNNGSAFGADRMTSVFNNILQANKQGAGLASGKKNDKKLNKQIMKQVASSLEASGKDSKFLNEWDEDAQSSNEAEYDLYTQNHYESTGNHNPTLMALTTKPVVLGEFDSHVSRPYLLHNSGIASNLYLSGVS